MSGSRREGFMLVIVIVRSTTEGRFFAFAFRGGVPCQASHSGAGRQG